MRTFVDHTSVSAAEREQKNRVWLENAIVANDIRMESISDTLPHTNGSPSIGTTQSRPSPARAEKVMESGAPDPFSARHPKTLCCGYEAKTALPYPVMWNPFNKVVQCHNCGHVFEPISLPTNAKPENHSGASGETRPIESVSPLKE
jgi:hypothetical protein